MNTADSKKGDQWIIILFIIAVAASILNAVISYSINKNYTLYGKIACDPFTSDCFTEICEEDDLRCLSYADNGTDAYFQFAYFNAKDASACQNADCINTMCNLGQCLVFECTEENIGMLETENSCDAL